MTDTQLYLAIGIPTIAILIGILINGMQFSHATTAMNARFFSLEARLGSVATRLEALISKIMELDARLTRLEERLERR